MTPYWSDGKGLTIYHGTALDILPGLSDVALTVTSPPYNTLENAGGDRLPAQGFYNPGRNPRARAWGDHIEASKYPDDLPEADYQAGQTALAAALSAASRPGASLFYNHKCRWRDGQLIHPLEIVGTFTAWRVQQEMIWARPAAPWPGSKKFRTSDERIYWLTDERAAYTWDNRVEGYGTVWKMNPAQSERGHEGGHPAPFPIEIPWRAILATTTRGDLVLDPYMGTGTTLRAARRLGRRAVGIDNDEKWCEMAATRLETA